MYSPEMIIANHNQGLDGEKRRGEKIEQTLRLKPSESLVKALSAVEET